MSQVQFQNKIDPEMLSQKITSKEGKRVFLDFVLYNAPKVQAVTKENKCHTQAER